MKLSTHVVGQVAAGLVQLANLYGGVIPAKYQPVVALVVGIAQATMAFIAHYSQVPVTK